MSYQRVIPRDLFNEAKLLKCLGQLALMAHDYPALGLKMQHFAEDEGFRIEQNPDSGALYCSNMELFVSGQEIHLSTRYNCKDAYPLNFIDDTAEESGRVFSETGDFTPEFSNLIASLK